MKGKYLRTSNTKAKQSKANALTWQSPEVRAKYLLAFSKRPINLAGAKAMHKALEEYRKDSEWMARFSLSQQGPKSRYIVKDKVAFDKSYKARGEKLRGRIFTTEHRKHLSEAAQGRIVSEGQKALQSRIMKEKWANPEYARRVSALQNRTPNKAELKLLSILDNLFPDEWKYVGDGQVWMDGRNPDFININGKKQVIELFSHYWHIIRAETDNDEQDRMNHYKKYGFDCFIIWDSQLTEEEVLKCLH